MSSCGKALIPFVIISIVTWSGCVGLVAGVDQVTVTTAGGGTGVVTSMPNGINCSGLGGGTTSGTCQLTFRNSPTLTLIAAPGQGFTFGGWTGCKSASGTTCTVSGAATVTANFTASLQSINHIIFLAQENRSFDSYFGAMRAYWAKSGVPDQAFDGLPQFNPAGDPNAGPAPTNPGCDPASPFIPPNTNPYCQINSNSPAVPSFHLQTMCIENPSPSWGESHRDWAVQNPVAAMPTMDGFVDSAANDARQHTDNQGLLAPYFDTNGVRAMGYYDGTDLNYYYALATAFSTSDKWFSPVMSRTPPNREYLIAATSHGYAYPIGQGFANDTALNPGPTIFEKLEQANPPISWKIYVPTSKTPCESNPTVTCLLGFTYLHDFTFSTTINNNPSAYQNNIVPISQFATDLKNNTLPQVAQIEPASVAGLDEHPTDDDPAPGQFACCSVQAGASYVKSLIDQFMGSSSWPNSVFILTWDEFGGLYDHVPPQASVNPDGIAPVDLFPYDPCYQNPSAGPTCNFNYTGYRVPLVVISPFAKKNFVSHQVRDYTAILKLIETRFSLPALTQRDAAQTAMDDATTGFFDFNNVPWRTPPTNLPAQTDLGQSACFVNPPPTSP